MSFSRRLLVALAAIFFLSAPSTAQDRIDPARAIRVVELVDGSGGRMERAVLEPAQPAEMLRIQVELARAGFDPGLRSGVLDEPTREALRLFQVARGLEVCGCTSYETVVSLGIPVDLVGKVEVRRTPGVRTADGSPVLGFVPHGFAFGRDHFFFFHGRFFHPFFFGPGVVVGGEPALGAGQVKHIFPRSSVGVRFTEPPSRSRPGSRLRPANPGGGGDSGSSRPPRPRPTIR